MLIILVLVHRYAVSTFARIQVLLMINGSQMVVSILQCYSPADIFKAEHWLFFLFVILLSRGASTRFFSFYRLNLIGVS